MNITVKAILDYWLKYHGYDGLVGEQECGCMVGDLMKCDDVCSNCRPGFLGPDPSGDCDFLIYPTKEAAKEAQAQCKRTEIHDVTDRQAD